ncbi:MAG: aryl-sulfate sulfotransferase, partial [Deltaproteobacteria bacterium]|nr:aryl-sulfate sulfotransferase [Deltaproteobacteria bacterium]
AVDEGNNDVIEPTVLEVTTEPLPQDFPVISVTSTPELMEPGVTLFEAAGYLVAVNETGEVVWYHRIQFFNPSFDRDVRRMSNGNLLLLLARRKMLELDMLGNIVRIWHPAGSTNGDKGSIPVDTLAFHHEVYEMESGNFLIFSIEFRLIDNFPSSTTNPSAPTETALVAGDVVVEFTPKGAVVNEWPLLDILDPLRINYGAFRGDWDFFYEEVFGVSEVTRDWSHGNGVIHDPTDDSIIVSLRHQDAVVKFSRQTGELKWILGPHENWDPGQFGEFLLTPQSDYDFFFQYHQHAPMITNDGTLMIYDNGNFRASPFDPVVPNEENSSRAIEYAIDENSKEIEIVWEYGLFEEETFFTPFIGDADSLPQTGNVLITFGGKQPARIIEVTHTAPAQKVFDLSIAETFSYRSERLPSLYP